MQIIKAITRACYFLVSIFKRTSTHNYNLYMYYVYTIILAFEKVLYV